MLKEDLGLSYRMTKKITMYCNMERCLVLRQQYALKMLAMMNEVKHIINCDEIWLNESSFMRRLWFHSFSSPATTTMFGIIPRVSIIAALDTDGRSWFSLTQATTDQQVLLVFL